MIYFVIAVIVIGFVFWLRHVVAQRQAEIDLCECGDKDCRYPALKASAPKAVVAPTTPAPTSTPAPKKVVKKVVRKTAKKTTSK